VGGVYELKCVPLDWLNEGEGLWRKPIKYKQNGKIYESTKKYYEMKCLNCGELFLADSLNKTARFCSLHCAGSGKFSAQWKGGTQKYGGYIYIWMPDHPNANKRGYVAEHVIIAANKIGRPLMKNEQVHHINGNKTDNTPDNLVVLTINKHRSLHESIKRELAFVMSDKDNNKRWNGAEWQEEKVG
jgi:hypothetical protein